MPTTKNKTEKLIPLSQALDRAALSFPHISRSFIRESVVSGRIPSKRKSDKKLARYLVAWADVARVLDTMHS